MNWLEIKRIKQVLQYGWKDAGKIAKEYSKNRIIVYSDILLCYWRYHLWSNQYLKENFYFLNKNEREELGSNYRNKNYAHEEYVKSHFANRQFLHKWKDYHWELSAQNREKRLEAYTKQYNMGKGCIISFDVHIERNHFLPGTIKIGDNVMLSKHVYIDYSGELIIHDNVSIANGVIIETHTHPLEESRQQPVPGRLIIGDSVSILTRSYIADTCHSIGRYARIGAGTYVRSNIPPYAIVMGNPAKIIGFLYSPEEMVEFEKDKYPEGEKTPLEQYTLWYEKYYKSRTKEIKSFIKL